MFFNETLNAKYVVDESGLYTFFGINDFSTISGAFDDGTYIFQPEYADVLAPFDESVGKTVIFYDNTQTLGAGVLTKTDDKKVFVLGFPFETVLEKDNKISVLQQVLDEFEISPREYPDDPVENPDDDSDSGTPDDDSSDSDDTPDEDTADTGNENPDEDNADSSDSTDPTDTSDSSDSSDPSDPADSTDTSDSADPTDPDDSGDTSENDKTDEEKGGKGGCSLLLF